MGVIIIPKNHILNKENTGFSMSAAMTEIACYVGQEVVFETASELIEKLSGTAVNAKQIERVCHHYGQQLEQEQALQIESGDYGTVSTNETPHYIMADGCMVYVRGQGWKEMKLCRVFEASDVLQISKDRGYISQSQYIAHLGDHRAFFDKVEYHTDHIKKKIVIADGAKWIWNWVDETYPDALQILDFYHAKEHLCQFAALQWKDEQQKHHWISQQSLLLLNNKMDRVLDNIQILTATDNKAAKARDALIAYYNNNKHRMEYQTYRNDGLLIGSGPMEAAHRSVIQQRMKLSGQRWTSKGVQQVANLRAANKSNQWNRVVNLIRYAA